MQKKYRFAEIDNIHKNDDGTIVVSGYASSGEVDSDGEVITPEAMAAAIPDYMKFGAVREMHGKSAAGTALDVEVQEDGRTSFSALVVDPVAIKKVETGVYKGFSIGGKVKSRDPSDDKIITALNLIEVSLVDRPANPEALITMYKADDIEQPNDEGTTIPTSEGDETTKSETVPAEIEAPASDIVATSTTISQAVIKAGARFSSTSKASLAEMHKMAQDICAKFDGLGYKDAEEEGDDAEESEKNSNVDLTKSDDLAKALEKADELTKAFAAQSVELKKANSTITNLNAEIENMKKQPAPPKGFGLQIPISKSQDSIVSKADENPHKAGTPEHVEWTMKAIHRGDIAKV